MKKYIIKYADGRRQNIMQAAHSSYNEAVETLMDYLNANNDHLSLKDPDYLSPFNFKLEEAEYTEVNEDIPDFKSAKKAIAADFYLSADKSKLAASLMNDINPKHIEVLDALNKLFTIAQAWNKADDFVPDFSDWNQYKWYPIFIYDNHIKKFIYYRSSYAVKFIDASSGARLYFKTPERAEQFGKQFIDLYSKAFLY